MPNSTNCPNEHTEGLAKPPTKWKELSEFVRKAVTDTIGEQGIFDFGVGERTIAHRFALHLQKSVRAKKRWLVDCEYNRIKGDLKFQPRKAVRAKIKSYAKKSPSAVKDKENCSNSSAHALRILDKSKSQDKRIFPDVVVHFRGCECFNALVVEVKLGSPSDAAVMLDWAKLSIFTANTDEAPKYPFGLFLELISKDEVAAWMFDRKENRIHKLDKNFEIESEVEKIFPKDNGQDQAS